MLQSFAEMTLTSGLERLDKRQGWRGVISNINDQKLPIKEQLAYLKNLQVGLPENRFTALVREVKTKNLEELEAKKLTFQ